MQASCGIDVHVHRCIRMRAQDRCRDQGTDLAFEARLHSGRFAGVGDYAQDLPGLQDLADAHGDGTLWYIFEGGEPTLTKLLAPASFV